MKTLLSVCFLLCFAVAVRSQSAGINTVAPAASAQLDITAANKGILIPRIDYSLRPATNVLSGTLIYVTANGPSGNNAFYYYNGSSWLKYREQTENQTLSLTGTNLTISNANTVALGDIFPVAGTIKCGGVYINPFTNNNNCGACGNVCPGAQTCKNGSCQ